MSNIKKEFVQTFKMSLLLLAVSWLVACTSTNHQVKEVLAKKSSLSILYVGTDPAKPLTGWDVDAVDKDRVLKLRQTRGSDYETLLKKYFERVKVVYSDHYREEMSAQYDVTIFDALPKLISGGRSIDPMTGEEVYKRRKYLSEDYNHATIMIGQPSAFIGEGRSLKMDHLCLCLDAHAHGMKLEHPIFHKPYKVDVTYEEIKTPGNYKIRYGGRNLGETMPVWRIQTEGYREGKSFPVGLVSTGYGFDNGIDAEWISSGLCDKGVEATAIGRHASFFHWGFVAAPEYMTDSAKLAFINSIHYIAPFKGAKQVTRKIKGLTLRGYYKEKEWMISDRGSAARRNYSEEKRLSMIKKKEQILVKKAAGEVLSEFENMVVSMPDRPTETRGEVIKDKSLKEKYGEDWAAYERYYAENIDYFYALTGEWYQSALDEDAKTLGIANSSIKLLDTCVEMLKKGDRVDMANRILRRYTNESFQTADEWRVWLKANRDQLYFSEGDGYKFIVLPKDYKGLK